MILEVSFNYQFLEFRREGLEKYRINEGNRNELIKHLLCLLITL